MVNVGDDHVLKADVEYALVASVALMILPCILMNSYIIWKILKQNDYKVLSVVPKTVNLYYNIAISDVLMGTCVMPWVIYYILIGRPAPMGMGEGVDANMTASMRQLRESHEMYTNNSVHNTFCVFSGYTYNVVTRVTSLTVLLLSIDRTHAIYFPLTYNRDIFYSIYRYCTYLIWVFALGIQAIPFVSQVPYVEQMTRELTCSWSISQLLGIKSDEVNENKLQLFFPYFVLVLVPLVLPTVTSVLLSVAVFIKILIKRYEYMREKINQSLMLSDGKQTRTKHGYLRAAMKFHLIETKESHKLKSLSKASYTMLMIVSMYTVFFSYYWLMCITNALFLLGVKMSESYLDNMITKPFWVYMHSSFHISVFLHSTFTPFLVYYRVIVNLTSNKAGSAKKNRSKQSQNGKTVMNSIDCNNINNNKNANNNKSTKCWNIKRMKPSKNDSGNNNTFV